MRSHRGALLIASSIALGAATAIGVALVLNRATRPAWASSDVAWLKPVEGVCLVQTTMSRLGCTRQTYMEAKVFEVRPLEVVYEDVGYSAHLVTAARGNEEDRPEVTYRGDSNSLIIEEAGFPFRCLREKKWEFSGGCDFGSVAEEGSIPWGKSDFETVPGQPIWGGMIANTVVWGSPWMAGFLFIGKVRRARRRRRCVCEACGYSMAGLEADASCPECGRSRGR